jgi:cell division protein FtsW (lipid II flippase)
MDPFSYLVVLTSIVLGLGVTRLVAGFGNLMQTRRRKRTYWVHTLWMMNLLLTMAIVWWVAYRWREQQHWNFFLFLWLLLSPTVLYLISALMYPDSDEAQTVADWQKYYFENHRDIFLLYAAVFPIDLVDTLLKGVGHFREQGPLYLVTMVMWFVLLLVAAFTERKRYHAFLAVLFTVYNLLLLGTSLLTDTSAVGASLLSPK